MVLSDLFNDFISTSWSLASFSSLEFRHESGNCPAGWLSGSCSGERAASDCVVCSASCELSPGVIVESTSYLPIMPLKESNSSLRPFETALSIPEASLSEISLGSLSCKLDTACLAVSELFD